MNSSKEMNTGPKLIRGFSPEINLCIRQALAEDIGAGDVTTDCIVSAAAQIGGQIIAKQNGIMAGFDVAAAVFLFLDENISVRSRVQDGSRVESGTVIGDLFGSAHAVLTGERTALNFLGRMSGIATLTKRFVDMVAGTRAKILDTRKTAPGLRAIDKLAVRSGGGDNHRHGLYDMILIKDNHIDFAGSLVEAVRRAREANSGLEIEVEVRTLTEVAQALELGVRRLLLDNMSLDDISLAVKLNEGRAELEASGSITLANVRRIAETGVDYVSVGALTHSAKALDISLIVEPKASTRQPK